MLIINQFNKILIMNIINKYIYLIVVILLAGAGFSSCTKDEPTVIVSKTAEDYKLQMSQFVASEKAIIDACVIGYNKGDFKVASTSNFVPYKTAYQTVLTAAETVLNKQGVTIAEIVASNKTLATAGKNFNGTLFISDRRPLVDPIIAAEALNTATVVGTAVGQVAQEVKTTFTAAVSAAKATRDASTTIERQVEEAVVKLDDAKKAFEAAIIK
jgi:hypothetical protein